MRDMWHKVRCTEVLLPLLVASLHGAPLGSSEGMFFYCPLPVSVVMSSVCACRKWGGQSIVNKYQQNALYSNEQSLSHMFWLTEKCIKSDVLVYILYSKIDSTWQWYTLSHIVDSMLPNLRPLLCRKSLSPPPIFLASLHVFLFSLSSTERVTC